MYAPNQIMFPAEIIPELRDSRGAEWDALIERLRTLPQTHEEVLAFMLMMIRLNGCMECETDSYRAMRGCDLCALQTLRRYKGTDEQLFECLGDARRDVEDYMARSGYQTLEPMVDVA